MSELKRTPLFNKHVELGAKIVDFAGFEMPIQYEGLSQEHDAVRNECGIFDVSHMGEVHVKGDRAKEFVQNIFTNDLSTQEDGQVLYGMMLYENGTVVDDLLVYKHNDTEYFLVINASNIDKDFAWMQKQNTQGVSLENASDSYSEIAIQGPKAQEILQKMTDTDLNEIGFFRFKTGVKVDGVDCLVSRTGYTGEDGFEVYGADLGNVWDKMIALGAKPIGLGARDTLRFEAGLPLYGHELSDEICPIDAGLGIFVKTDADFIGKDACVAIKENRTRKIAGIELVDRGIAREGYKVYSTNGEELGKITTGYKLGDRAVALAMVPFSYKIDDEIQVEIRNKMVKAKIVSKRFMTKNYKK